MDLLGVGGSYAAHGNNRGRSSYFGMMGLGNLRMSQTSYQVSTFGGVDGAVGDYDNDGDVDLFSG